MILLTGATGFVGRNLCSQLLASKYDVTAVIRREDDSLPSGIKTQVVGSIESVKGWEDICLNVDVIIHTAARVHVMDDVSSNPLEEFRKVNTQATLNLARQAAKVGVKRFIFISSIKVNGESTSKGQAFTPEDRFIPNDPYALSKYEAEQGLLELAKRTGLEVIIIRPPLVYGPNVKANFLSMLKWVRRGAVLPLGAIHNQRSLVAVDNLVSFVIYCIDHPKATNEIFLISDGEDVSITELLTKVAKAFGKKLYLIPAPVGLMNFVAKIIGKSDVACRLFDSLQIDSSKARDLLDWKPVITMDEQLKKTADAYLKHEKTL